MGIFSKILLTTGTGSVIGGTTVYFGLSKLHGSPISRWDDNWDMRDPSFVVRMAKPEANMQEQEYDQQVKKYTPEATRHILLIRHGQYNLDGQTDEQQYLTPSGEKQALHTGQHLKELNLPYGKVIRSTMTRATQTAKLIEQYMPGVPVVDSQLLTEGTPPVKPNPEHSFWKPEPYEYFQEGSNMEAAFRKYIYRAHPDQTCDSYEILVCHANVIRYFIFRALQLPLNAWLRFRIPSHASITWLCIYPDGEVALEEYGGMDHMPKDLIIVN